MFIIPEFGSECRPHLKTQYDMLLVAAAFFRSVILIEDEASIS